MRAIGAGALEASSAMDHVQTDKAIDFRKVSIVGRHRGGNTALWIMAKDARFAMCIDCSGNTGTVLSRRRFGETVQKINAIFSYWFCDNYNKHENYEDDLPVNQHEPASVWPGRPVYTTIATKDLRADPKGRFVSIKAREPV